MAPVGSIPTRSRHPAAPPRHGALLVAALALGPVGMDALAAQDSLQVRPDTAALDSAAVDSVPPPAPGQISTDSVTLRPVKPLAAFWRSLLVPGWGQLKVGRKLTAGLFIATEGLTIGMSLKADQEVGYLRRIGADSAAIAAKVRKREDWYVLLAVNHLLAGLEAFVAAHLSDFPGELRVERAPDRVNAGFAIPVRVP
ncbi:MAG TPA: hypothetical protein VFU46_00370 [Gemmatimonadales bacterium]|nr:hypothetical protein [Gemmatimonadales bacterium]